MSVSTDEILRRSIASVAENRREPEFRWVKLAGDASLRRYYRIWNGKRSYVLMLTDPFNPSTYPFLTIQNFLRERKIACPEVFAVDGTNGAVLLQDLGDELLNDRLAKARGVSEEKQLYKKAIDLIVDFHARTGSRVAPQPENIEGFHLAFDEEKLMWEVNFTLEHWNGPQNRRKLSDDDQEEIRSVFRKICREIAAEPRVFTHRDYHSRNIMIGRQGAIYLIDFQDARMGPRQYDLASLLRDSYYRLSDETVDELLDYYLRKAERAEKKRINRTRFFRVFDLMTLQRSFKAVGSFCSFYVKRSDPSYLPYVGTALENMRRVLVSNDEFRRLQEVLFCGP